jgi:hypothetical protein
MPVYEADVCESYPPERPSHHSWHETVPGNPTVVIWAYVTNGRTSQRQLRVFTLPVNLAIELFGQFFRRDDLTNMREENWTRAGDEVD